MEKIIRKIELIEINTEPMECENHLSHLWCCDSSGNFFLRLNNRPRKSPVCRMFFFVSTREKKRGRDDKKCILR